MRVLMHNERMSTIDEINDNDDDGYLEKHSNDTKFFIQIISMGEVNTNTTEKTVRERLKK